MKLDQQKRIIPDDPWYTSTWGISLGRKQWIKESVLELLLRYFLNFIFIFIHPIQYYRYCCAWYAVHKVYNQYFRFNNNVE